MQVSSIISAQQINSVIISGLGGQHDLDVKNAFLVGYASYNGDIFMGDIFLYVNSLHVSFDYAATNNYDLMIRSTTGVPYGITIAPSYPSVKLVMPAGSNSYIEAFSGDVINSPVVITGAGTDSNQTAYELEFYSIDPITSGNASSFSNGYIAGQLAYIANTLDCSFDSARTLARINGSENGNWDFYNGFGKIQLSDVISGTLPVELTSFTTYITCKNVILKWKTETEVNNYGFEVQRSKNKNEWNVLGFVKGNGNSSSPQTYSYIDKGIMSAGKYHYRLRQIDNDGKYKYSKTLQVNFNVPFGLNLNQNYPNPFNPSTTIGFTIQKSGNVSLKIYNPLGEEVAELVNEYREAGVYTIKFSAEDLPSGMYIYQLTTKETSLTKKMLFLK